jgi:hypothetical protein
MAVAVVSLGLAFLSVGFNALLLATGLAAELERNGDDPTTRVVVRLCWAVVMLLASGYVLWGGLQMKRMRQYEHARAAAVVASIPCLGPCCLIGLPFGIWALLVLHRPEVQSEFEA